MARWRPALGLVILPVLFLALSARPSPAFQDGAAAQLQATPTAPAPYAPTATPPAPQSPTATPPLPGEPPPEPAVDWSSIEMLQAPVQAPAAPAPAAAAPPAEAAPEASGDLSPAAAPAAETMTHIVARGDNLTRIARRYGVRLEALLALNQITNRNLIYVGQLLLVPASDVTSPPPAVLLPNAASEASSSSLDGDSYLVQRGDTLFKIAQRFGSTVQALAAANGLANPNAIQPGQALLIPRGEGAPAAPVVTLEAAAAPAPTAAPETGAGPYVVQAGDSLFKIAQRFGTTVQAIAAANNLSNVNRLPVGLPLVIPASSSAASAPPEAALYIWPVRGRILQSYRYGHGAIDIEAVAGTEFVAIAAGTVEFASWNTAGYGNLTIIDHGNGVRSLYAHQSEFLVAPGQRVEQGQVIGKTGSTGWSNWPHLHLEMIVDLRRVDPCGYLPGGC